MKKISSRVNQRFVRAARGALPRTPAAFEKAGETFRVARISIREAGSRRDFTQSIPYNKNTPAEVVNRTSAGIGLYILVLSIF